MGSTNASVLLMLSFLAAITISPNAARAQAESTHRRVVLPVQEGDRISVGARLVDVIRSRLSMYVEDGRFSTADGVSEICVATSRSRRSARLRFSSEPSLPGCEMVALFLNGNRIPEPGSFLLSAAARDFESIELIRAAEALGRFGISHSGRDVIELWSAGRGPYVRDRF